MSKKSILSSRQSATMGQKISNRHIVALSGGVASAWVAKWVRDNVNGEIIYYFNDVHWEHEDLYRFLGDLESVLKIKIYIPKNVMNPEEIFYKKKMLGSNRTPICSRILKAEMLQQFINKGDTLYFGIDPGEIHRAARITPIYERFGCKCVFPLIDNMVNRSDMFKAITDLGIEIPQMYKDGFTHNNCSGGCVRSGKKQWKSLYRKYPAVYAERERVETEFTVWNNKRRLEKDPSYTPRAYHFMKDMSLRELREVLDAQPDLDFDDDEWQGECIGICGDMS